ncbi:MAG: hypothetical protein V4501_12860 [Pseudomonadota bacterium]
MLFRRFTDFILRGRTQAMVTAFVLGFMPVIGLISSLIATLVTLRKGMQEGALVFIAAVLPILLVFSSVPQAASPSTSISAIDVVIMIATINALAWISAVVLGKTSSWSLVLDVLGVLGVVTVIVLHLAYPDMAGWWQQWLTNYFAGVGVATGGDAHSLSVVQGMTSEMKYYATGIAGIMFSFYALVDLLIGRWWQDTMFNPGGLSKELKAIRLSKICAIIFLVGIVFAFSHVVMMQDAMLVLGMVFALAGLSLMHYVIAAKHIKWGWVTLIYILLSIVPESIALFIIAGLLDSVFDFRKKFNVPGSGLVV